MTIETAPTALPTAEGDAAPEVETEPEPEPEPEPIDPDLHKVQRKWQMASCAHFLETFKSILPLRRAVMPESTPEDEDLGGPPELTPLMLEQAVVNPVRYRRALLAFRRVIQSLLVALNESSERNVFSSWYLALKRVVEETHAEWYPDCYAASGSGPSARKGKSILSWYEDGTTFLCAAPWTVRLGLLASLCDHAAECSDVIRNAVLDAQITRPPTELRTVQAATDAPTEANGTPVKSSVPIVALPPTCLEQRGIRLRTIGRCSRKRSFFIVGKTRIYSGYKQKGNGGLVVECSDSSTMCKLATALESSKHPRDVQLANDVRAKYLGPLLDFESREKRKAERKRREEKLREETRLRNAHRPRRKSAAYV